MRVAIVSNVDNAKGLQRDTELLTSLMESAGHAVTPVHFQKAKTPPPGSFDLAVFLEVGGPREARFFDCAPVRWLVPNPEWWEPDDSIAPFSRVLCKTGDAERIFGQRADSGDRVRFTGWDAQSRRDIAEPEAYLKARTHRRLEFLHIAGGSSVKGTRAILDAWEQYSIPHRLTVVTSLPFTAPKRPGNVAIMAGRTPEHVLMRLQREVMVHLQPSEYEGFGHVIHEGLSVGACVLTTDAEPMRSADGVGGLVRVSSSRPLKSARLWGVSPAAINDAVREVATRPPEWFDDVRVQAIRAFEEQRAAFRERLLSLLSEDFT